MLTHDFLETENFEINKFFELIVLGYNYFGGIISGRLLWRVSLLYLAIRLKFYSEKKTDLVAYRSTHTKSFMPRWTK